MSKITKSDLLNLIQEQADMLVELTKLVELNKRAIIKLENKREKPQLKQLDQSVFNGLDSKWKYAAVDEDGSVNGFDVPVYPHGKYNVFMFVDDCANSDDNSIWIGGGYDASNWKNSLIKRDIAKELLEVNLSSELSGSELCKAMLDRGDTRIMCRVYDIDRQHDITHVIRAYSNGKFHTKANRWTFAIPINNQGEPLTARDVGI